MAHLTFSDYVKITYPVLSPPSCTTQGQYVAYFCSLLIEEELGNEENDSYPLRVCNMDDNDRGKIYRGYRPLSKDDAKYIYKNWTDEKIVNAILSASAEARTGLFNTFETFGVEYDSEGDEDRAQTIADNLRVIILSLANRRNSRTSDSVDYSIEDVNETCYYSQEQGLLKIGGREVRIEPCIAPSKINPSEKDNVYMKALLDVFSELLGEDIDSVDVLRNVNSRLYNELLRHRECFYSADSIRRIVMAAFSDGVKSFEAYMDEIYEGVIDVHCRSYSNGHERLHFVLDKSTSMILSRQKLERLYIVGAKEKKGICHMLVDEGRLTPWIEKY